MGSINWVGRSALGVLSLPFLGSTALAQENAAARERLPTATRAEGPRQGNVRYTSSGGGQQGEYARSGKFDPVTGGFKRRGERLNSASKLIHTVRLGRRWRRTYAADTGFGKMRRQALHWASEHASSAHLTESPEVRCYPIRQRSSRKGLCLCR
jgi:hypothetical protein